MRACANIHSGQRRSSHPIQAYDASSEQGISSCKYLASRAHQGQHRQRAQGRGGPQSLWRAGKCVCVCVCCRCEGSLWLLQQWKQLNNLTQLWKKQAHCKRRLEACSLTLSIRLITGLVIGKRMSPALSTYKHSALRSWRTNQLRLPPGNTTCFLTG